MKILICIPHFYRPEEKSPYGSLEKDPKNRIHAFSAMLQALYQTFQAPHCMMNICDKTAIPADHADPHQIDIVICTTENHHLLDQIPIPKNWYTHHATNASPRLLGFACHAVLRDALNKNYDYYCYMEDDLFIHDPMFFYKLKWFTQQAGNNSLLQPHLYETTSNMLFKKVYLNGEINPGAAAPFQDIRSHYEIQGTVIGVPIVFRRTTNPHSGCFFLNSAQMQHWASQSYFLDGDISFVDPMASAATLGITKTFNVYKPALENAYFAEIEHMDKRYLWQVGSAVSIAKEKFEKLGYRFIEK
jgi:hypothetical protein